MLRRLFVGLVLGLIVGGIVAAGLVAGLGVTTFATMGGAIGAYLAAALTGVLTGLVAGKPIWSSGAKVEAGLKAFFGALVGAGLMFALRQWAGSISIDLPAVGAHGATAIKELPAASLPLVAAVLGGFFELDNTGDGGKDKANLGPAPSRSRVAAAAQGNARATPASAARVTKGDRAETESEDEAEIVSRRAKR